MAFVKISELEIAETPLDGTELIEIVQSGVNKKVQTSLFQLYIIAGSYGTENDLIPDSNIIFRHKFTDDVTFPASFSNSNFWSEVAATSQAIFSITKNGTQIATATFSASGVEASFTMASGITFVSGDIIRIISPIQDSSLAGLSWSLRGVRS